MPPLNPGAYKYQNSLQTPSLLSESHSWRVRFGSSWEEAYLLGMLNEQNCQNVLPEWVEAGVGG